MNIWMSKERFFVVLTTGIMFVCRFYLVKFTLDHIYVCFSELSASGRL